MLDVPASAPSSRTGLASNATGCSQPTIERPVMLKHSIVASALAGALLSTATAHAQFATRVEAYEPGVGYAVEFGTDIPYTDSATALGAPSTVTPGEFGGP